MSTQLSWRTIPTLVIWSRVLRYASLLQKKSWLRACKIRLEMKRFLTQGWRQTPSLPYSHFVYGYSHEFYFLHVIFPLAIIDNHGYRWPLAVISCHHWPATVLLAIINQQWSSLASNVHQWLSMVLNCHHSISFSLVILRSAKSMFNKVDDIKGSLTKNHCDIVIFIESWLSSRLTIQFINSPGYVTLRRNISTRWLFVHIY